MCTITWLFSSRYGSVWRHREWSLACRCQIYGNLIDWAICLIRIELINAPLDGNMTKCCIESWSTKCTCLFAWHKWPVLKTFKQKISSHLVEKLSTLMKINILVRHIRYCNVVNIFNDIYGCLHFLCTGVCLRLHDSVTLVKYVCRFGPIVYRLQLYM